jgi:hypothetical protein
VPLRLGVRRVTAGPGAFALAAAGVVVAACSLAIVLAASLVVQDRAVGRSVGELSPGQRALQVTWVGVSTTPSDRWAALDRQVRTAMRPVGGRPPTAVLIYRDTRFGKQVVRLGAADGLNRIVRLTSGRLPRTCAPGNCEVVAIGASRGSAPGLTVTGRGSLTTGAEGEFFRSAAQGDRLVLAPGIPSVTSLPRLADTQRTYGWVSELRPGDVHAWDVDGFQTRVERARTKLQASSLDFALTAPTVALAAAHEKAQIAGRRLLLVGGQAVVLLLAFVLLAATRLRPGARAATRRLESFGATGWQTRIGALSEAAVIVVPATLLGWLLGAVGALVLARAADTPAGAVLSRSALSGSALGLVLLQAAAATLVFYLGSRARAVTVGGASISVADVAAAGALVAVLVAFAVGGTDAESLGSSSGTGIVLMLLPGLIAIVAAVVIARILHPLLRASERAVAHRSPSLKLALLSLARASGTATLAVVFVSVSVGLAIFAATYRSTLSRNDADRAAFQVPLDYTVKRNPRLRPEGTPVGPAYAARFGAVPVVRLQGEAPSIEHRGVTLLGLPAGDLTRIRWRGDFASEPPRALQEQIGGPPVSLQGTPIPADARELSLPVTIHGDPINLSANVRTPDGRFVVLDLGEPPNDGRSVARARIPPEGRGGLLVGLVVEFSRSEAFTAAHRETGAPAPIAIFRRGLLELGRPSVTGSRPLAVDYRDWVDPRGRKATGAKPGLLALRYLLTENQVFRLRPAQPTDGAPIPVIASSSLARAAGSGAVVPLFVGTTPVNVRIAASAHRFPSISGDFVVADRSRLETALNSSVPGSALAQEAWVSGGPGLAAQLERGPVRVTSRRAVESDFRSDPLAHGTLLLFGAAALAALVLSLVGLALTVAVDLRDEAGELFDLETQGVGPAGLRRQVALRAGVVAAAGLVGGVLIGVTLALAVLDSIAVSANSTEPVPPLQLAPDWASLVVGLVLFALAAGAVVALITRSSFREETA